MCTPLRVGVAKADGLVLTIIRRNCTLPQHRSAILTTSMDDQTKITVKIVVGVSPQVKDNTIIAELVLDGLSPRPAGIPLIRIDIDIEWLGETRISVGEIGSTLSASVVLHDITSVSMNALQEMLKLGELELDQEEHVSDNGCDGQGAQGALSEE